MTGAIIIIKINESFVYEPNENKTVLWLESSGTCAPMVNRHFRIGKGNIYDESRLRKSNSNKIK